MLSGRRDASFRSARHSSTPRLCGPAMRAAHNREGPKRRQRCYHGRAMRVTILYFAAARERAGTGTDASGRPGGAPAADALAAACAKPPPLQAVAGKLRLAVDQEFAGGDRKLRDG